MEPFFFTFLPPVDCFWRLQDQLKLSFRRLVTLFPWKSKIAVESEVIYLECPFSVFSSSFEQFIICWVFVNN